jgi:tetratricopeptide (TPR) repeat protein
LAQEAAPGAPPAGGGAAAPVATGAVGPDVAGAAYHFALAKALFGEGEYEAALAAFGAAEQLDPHDPFIHLERAQLLVRVAQLVGAPGERTERLAEAAREVARARVLASQSADVLRGAAEVYIDLGPSSPDAATALREVLEALRGLDPEDVQVLFALGRLYLERGEADAAAEAFRRVASLTPENRMATTLLIEALLKGDKAAEAEGLLRDVLAEDPTALDARLTLAELAESRGDHGAALETLRGAPADQRGDPRLQRQVASSLYRAGDLEGALAATEALLARFPDERQPLILKVLVLAAQGKNAEAEALLGRVRRDDPTNLALAGMQARLLVREGRPEEAARLIAGLQAEFTGRGQAKEAEQAALELVHVRITAEQWAEAEAAAAALAEAADPEVRSAALALRVDALTELERYAEGLALLDRQGGSDADPAITTKRAELLLRLGREAEGSELLGLLGTSSDSQQVLAAAQTYQRLERYGDSIPILERLLTRDGSNAAAAFLLGAARERAGQHDAAETAFRRALEIEPAFHPALNYLGYMWAEKGERLEEALTLVQRAVALEPDNGAYVDSLGWAHFQLGQYQEAISLLERATRLEPGDATIYEHLGDAYRALGRPDEARQVYRRALDLGDDNADQVRRKLHDLEPPSP